MNSVLWINGMPGSGKSTLAKKLAERFKVVNPSKSVLLIDGDSVRRAFGNDLGYSLTERYENARRVIAFANLAGEQVDMVICSSVSLFDDLREPFRNKQFFYFEVFLEASNYLLDCRDQKNLYSEHGLKDRVGFDLPRPSSACADLVIDSAGLENKADFWVDEILENLRLSRTN